MPLPHAALSRLKKAVLWIAAIALLGAGAVWGIHRNSTLTAEYYIPLNIQALPADLVISSPVPSGVEIHVRGPRHAIKSLGDALPSCRLNLHHASEGMVQMPLNAGNIPLPEGLEPIRIEPSVLTLKIDRLVHKQVPVTVIYSGKPAAGYSVAQAGAEPASIRLSGPKNLIDPMDQAPTAAVEISGASAPIRKPLTLDLPEKVTVAGKDKTVSVHINIIETIGSRQFTGLSVVAKNARGQARFTPPTIDITVQGPVNILDNLEPRKGIDIHVDLTGLKPGVYVRRAVIGLPVKTTLLDARPELFTVTLTPPKKHRRQRTKRPEGSHKGRASP